MENTDIATRPEQCFELQLHPSGTPHGRNPKRFGWTAGGFLIEIVGFPLVSKLCLETHIEIFSFLVNTGLN